VSYDQVPINTFLQELKSVQLALISASQRHLAEAATKREHRVVSVELSDENSFQVGDYVLLKYPNRPPNKLSSLYRGPMIIHEKEREDIFQVLDLVTNKVYQTHINRLVKLKLQAGIGRAQLLALAAADIAEFEVEEILSHRGTPHRRSSMEFLVRWKGEEPADDTWEPWSNVKDLVAMDVYSHKNPSLKLG
jgi:hypothetical protein